MEIGSLNSGSFLQDMALKKNMREGSLEASLQEEQAATVSSKPLAAAGEAGVMDGNFSSSRSGESQSRYIKATMSGFASDIEMSNQQNAILNIGIVEASMARNNVEKMLAARRAERALQQDMNRNAEKVSERNLEETRENIEKRTEEAMQPDTRNADNAAQAAGDAGVSSVASSPAPAGAGASNAGTSTAAAAVAAAPAAPVPAQSVAVTIPEVKSVDISV